LLRGVLNNHSALAIPLEALFIADYLRVAERIPLEQLKELLIREPELMEWGIEVQADQVGDCDSIGDAIARVHEIYANSQGKSRWGQKTPRLVRHHELLRMHFPDARFIHIVRDPRAVVSSLVRSEVHRSTVWHASKRWIRDVEAGLALEHQIEEGVLRVRYEDLVMDPEAELLQIFEFLQVDSLAITPEQNSEIPEYSEFYENIHSNLSREISADFVEIWKEHLSDEEVGQVESLVGTLPHELGYAISSETLPQTFSPSVSISLRRVRGLLLQSWRYIRYRPRYLYGLIRRKWRFGLLREFFSELNY
jgi:hypothetical protein